MKVLVVLLLVAAVTAEVIDIKRCSGVPSDKCTIHEIRIDPCPVKSACLVQKGQDAIIAFDFTPHFSATKLKTVAYYGDIAWSDLDSDGCKVTSCPTEEGKQQSYSAKVHIGKKLPDGRYMFKWQLYDEADSKNMCCFEATVRLKKPKN